jgi:hypothetical protein
MPAGSGSITRTFESGLSSAERGRHRVRRAPRQGRQEQVVDGLPEADRESLDVNRRARVRQKGLDVVPASVALVKVWVGGDPSHS